MVTLEPQGKEVGGDDAQSVTSAMTECTTMSTATEGAQEDDNDSDKEGSGSGKEDSSLGEDRGNDATTQKTADKERQHSGTTKAGELGRSEKAQGQPAQSSNSDAPEANAEGIECQVPPSTETAVDPLDSDGRAIKGAKRDQHLG